jgi:hypothetical protein
VVELARPVNDIVPLEPPQVVGFVNVVDAMFGVAFTTTVAVPVSDKHPFTDVIRKYVPLAAVVTFVILLFCVVEVNEFGPHQLYDAPDTKVVLTVNVLPLQTGLFVVIAGVAGVACTVAAVVAVSEQLFTVAITV